MRAIAFLLSALTAAAAQAQTVALTFTGGSQSTSDLMRGWSFSTSEALVVESLGWFDFNGDGLATSHEVAIWTIGGSQQVSGTVTAGASGVLESRFRFTNLLSGTTLLPPGNYVIGGLSNSLDPVFTLVPPADTLTAPQITFIEERSRLTPGFGFPNNFSGLNNGTFGPSFRFVSVPEPSATLFFGCTLAWCIRRRV